MLDFPVSLGTYQFPARPEDPCLLHLERVPCQPGLPARDQQIAGRQELLTTTFQDFERNIRGQLGRVLSPGGFDPARDIEAITVNRWPHGYAYEYNSLYDPDWPPGSTALRDWPATVRKDFDCEFRRRGARVHGRGDQPGVSSRSRSRGTREGQISLRVSRGNRVRVPRCPSPCRSRRDARRGASGGESTPAQRGVRECDRRGALTSA